MAEESITEEILQKVKLEVNILFVFRYTRISKFWPITNINFLLITVQWPTLKTFKFIFFYIIIMAVN